MLGVTSRTNPYETLATLAGLPYWSGGLTLIAAAPGIGKTSWLLQMAADAALSGFPSAVVCYEHSPEELTERLYRQVEASLVGPHEEAFEPEVIMRFTRYTSMALVQAEDDTHTTRAIFNLLVNDYGFKPGRPAFLAVDYLQRIPVLGATGLVREELRAGEAAAALRKLARQNGWMIVAAAAVRSQAFSGGDLPSLAVLLGDERVAYEPDRIVFVERTGTLPCGCCYRLGVHVVKDRTAPLRTLPFVFWGRRFFLKPMDKDDPTIDRKAIGDA